MAVRPNRIRAALDQGPGLEVIPVIGIIKALPIILALAACNETPMTDGRAKSEIVAKADDAVPPSESQPAESPAESPAVPDSESPASTPPATEAAEPGTPAATPPLPALTVECLKGFPKPPFTPEELAKPEVIEVTDANNNSGVLYSDTTTSPKPRFVILNVTAKNVNGSIMNLKDPRGWYCVNLVTKNANNFMLNIGCLTTVATLNQSQQSTNGFIISRDTPCPTPTP